MDAKDAEARQFRRALVVRLGGLGDILLATPTVRALAAAFDGIRIDFVVGKGFSDTVAGLPYVDRVIEFDKKGRQGRPVGFVQFLQPLREAGYDLFVNLHPSAKTMLMGTASGASTRIAFVKDRRPQTDTGRVRHAIDDFYKQLAPIGITGTLDRSMDFFVPSEARRRVEALLTEAGLRPGELLLVVNPAATRLANRWPVERFAQVCDQFAAKPGVRVAIVGAEIDQETVTELKACSQSAHRLIDLCSRLNIKELGALLACADAFLTGDTGPLHIAAALNTPLVCLSGAANPDRTGPLSEHSTVLIDRRLPCVPCQRKYCLYGKDIRCMQGLSVAEVCDALGEWLWRRRPAGRADAKLIAR